MSKQLTSEDKKQFIESTLVKLTDKEITVVMKSPNIDKQYNNVRRYLRNHKEGQKQEQQYLLTLAIKYRHILEGLDCFDQELWTDEKKIKAFTDILDAYCDKGVKLVEDNYRRHLERLRLQREQRRKEYEAEQARYDKEIAELEEKIGDKPKEHKKVEVVRSDNETVVAEMSLIK